VGDSGRGELNSSASMAFTSRREGNQKRRELGHFCPDGNSNPYTFQV
jgi:hypothetical protein